MTLPETEVDRITQRVYTALNSGLNDAVARVVIEEIDKVHATYQVAESDWRDRGQIIAILTRANQELGERVAYYRDSEVPSLRSNADGWAKRAAAAEAALTVKRLCRNCGWDVTPEPGDQR